MEDHKGVPTLCLVDVLPALARDDKVEGFLGEGNAAGTEEVFL